jgi:hypothetical protein
LEKYFDSQIIDRGIWRDGIGGPTYPPPLAIIFAPLGWLKPSTANWVLVEISLIAILATGWLLQRLSNGRIPWDVAALAILTMPSFFLAVGVGQNSALSLLILAGGLTALSSGNCFAAGLVWGLFVYKPTWGLAICWVPAIMVRPRAYFGMAVSSLALSILSLPICGIHAWFDWLRVARQTEVYYQSLPRWTALSRDVPGLLRRIDQGAYVELAGWLIVVSVIAITAWTWRTRAAHHDRAPDAGQSSIQLAALVAGIMLACPRFMFYDMTLASVPVLLAFSQWRTFNRGDRLTLIAISALLWFGTAYSYSAWLMLGPPIDTFCLIALWCWSVHRCHAGMSLRSALCHNQEIARASP